MVEKIETPEENEDKVVVLEEKEEPAEVKVDEPQEEVVEVEAEAHQYKKKTEKRIKELLGQRKAADQRATEAELKSQNYEQRIHTLQAQTNTAADAAINQYKEGSQIALDSAKKDFKIAYESGDPDALSDAQTRVTNATISLREAHWAGNTRQRQQQKPAQQQQQPQQRAAPDPRATKWAENNSGWFNVDEITTAAAYAIDYKLKNEGWDPKGDDYWEELDKRLYDTFPTKFKSPEHSSPVAPVTRGPTRSRQIKLTPGEVEMAGRLGIELEDYAREKQNPGSTLERR